MAHRVTSIDELGPGVLRSLRGTLEIKALGANAIVLPPEADWFQH
jgi:hypothetical protein